jgi:hypothetical protein
LLQNNRPAQKLLEQLDVEFINLLVQMVQLLQLCTDHKLLEFRKLVSHVLLVYLEDEGTAYLLSELWRKSPANAQQLCESFVKVMQEPAPADVRLQVLFFKTKARLASAWTLLLTDILPPNNPAKHDAADAAITTTLLQADTAMLGVFLALLDQELPGLDDDRDNQLFHAFEQCAVAVLDCMADTPRALELHRQAALVPHAVPLLTRVYFRFLKVSGADVALIEADESEEYANRSAEEFKHALTCPHGARRLFDCDTCASIIGNGASTARSAAMAASRELIRLVDDTVVAAFLQFVKEHLAAPIAGTEAQQKEALALRGGALRAFAAVADRICTPTVAMHSNPAAEQSILQVIREVLLPETARTPEFEFAVHLRCIACTILERFVAYLSKQQLFPDMGNAVQRLMSCLCDQSQAVRLHALNSLDEMVKMRTDLGGSLSVIASDAMNWLAALLADETQPGNSEIMACLMTFLYKFDGRLGDVSPSHPNYANQSFRFGSVLKAHAELFATLSRRFEAVALPSVAGTANGDQLRQLCLLIEILHALVYSAPRDAVEPKTLHASLVPMLVPYAHVILDPRLLTIAARFGNDADAADILGMLPLSNPELWAGLLERICTTLDAAPHHAELLIPMLCDYLHSGDGVKYLFVGGGLVRIQAIVHRCLAGGTAAIQARAADLYRSTILISSRQPDDDADEMLWSYWRLTMLALPVPAAATAGRAPLVLSLFGSIGPVLEAFRVNPMERDPLVRVLCAVSSALYIDPDGCMPALKQQVTESGVTTMVLLIHIWSQYAGLIDGKRPLDLQLCALGLCSMIRVLLEQGVAIARWLGVWQHL